MSAASVALLLFLAIIVIGPSKLPSGAESIWLAMINLSNAQKGLPEIDLETARRMWTAQRSPIYSLVRLLYAAAEHLEELRKLLIVPVIVFIIAIGATSVFAMDILEILRHPAGDIELIFIRPPEMFLAYFNLVITSSILPTMPAILWQIMVFVRPAFDEEASNDRERRAFRLFRWFGFPAVLFLFVGGVCFAYFIMLPVALKYFATFGGDVVTAQWTISEYLKFVLNIMLWIGIAFETPLLIMLLSMFGIVNAKQLRRGWRVALVVIAVVAAVVTPTPDPFNMLIVMGPLFGLYLLGVLLAAIFGKKPEPEPA